MTLAKCWRKEVAAVALGLTEASVREAIRRGDIPARKAGSILRIRRDDLARAMGIA